MKKLFPIACLFCLIAANSHAQTVVPTAGVMSFSAFGGNDVAITFSNSYFQGNFIGNRRIKNPFVDKGSAAFPTFGFGAVLSCTYAGTQVYPDAELAYDFDTYPGYFKITVFSDKESKNPYMTCEGTQAPSVYAKFSGVGKFHPQ